MVFKYDFLIIGAGVAGMSYALKIAEHTKARYVLFAKLHLTRQTQRLPKAA